MASTSSGTPPFACARWDTFSNACVCCVSCAWHPQRLHISKPMQATYGHTTDSTMLQTGCEGHVRETDQPHVGGMALEHH